ncbi:MAG: helix-turn-helix domain-containing protein [Alphaproteobacteria bacterium]|nr:helix-turn-helix domain-containing protein [Alphaproteobacteria bacterium]
MSPTPLLSAVGQRIRDARQAKGWSQRELCRRSGVSPRFLVQVEAGEGNPSLARLGELAAALELSLAHLVAGLGPQSDWVDRVASEVRELPEAEQRRALLRVAAAGRPKIALVGLRGAGKSTVGRALAERLGCNFVELDREVEALAGMRLAEVFEYHGAEHYRELAREALERALAEPGRVVLELGGSVVTDPSLYALLQARARVIWLKASPEEHLRRVREQGDLRPMEGRPDALRELREILAHRTPLYAQAHQVVDTVAAGIPGSVDAVIGALRGA